MDSHAPDFTPPFCPDKDCANHCNSSDFKYIRHGFYRRQQDGRRVQRYRCLGCGVSFSGQSYASTYWLRRADLLPLLFLRLVGCTANRQIARELKVAPSTIDRLVARLGRACLLFQLERGRPRRPEPIVADGFETFELSQYHPVHFHVAVGKETHFVYGFTDSPLRRKGRMTSRQRRKRAEIEARHGRPDPQSVEKEFGALLGLVVTGSDEVVVHTDEHPAYRKAIARFPGCRVRHETTPGRAARTPNNPLFPVNLLDLLIRHSSSNHKRETIAFNKRRQAGAERFAVFMVWRNYMKSFSERRKDATPAQRAGLASRKLEVGDVLDRRRFPLRIGLPPRLKLYYDRAVRTLLIPNGTRHELEYAY